MMEEQEPMYLFWSSSQQMGNAMRAARGHIVKGAADRTLCGCRTTRGKHITTTTKARCWETMADVIGDDVDSDCVSCRNCRRIAKLDSKESK